VDPVVPVEDAPSADDAGPAGASRPIDEELPQVAKEDRRASSTEEGDDRATAVGNGKT
jgi:hypothetical protein